MKKHINLQIFGRVQGVGYRYSCMEAAKEFDIKGFVKNRPDGSVYVEAEGYEDQISLFRLWCYKGPSMAKVTDIYETPGEVRNFENFRIEGTGY